MTSRRDYRLTSEELIVLVWLLDYQSLPGLNFQLLRATLDREGQPLLSLAERCLLSRGWLDVANLKPQVDEKLGAIIAACASPQLSILISVKRKDGGGNDSILHVQPAMLVEHAFLAYGLHELRCLDNSARVEVEILKRIGKIPAVKQVCGTAMLALSTLELAQEMSATAGVGSTREFLLQAGVASDAAEALASSFAADWADIEILTFNTNGYDTVTEKTYVRLILGQIGAWAHVAQAASGGGGQLHLDPVSQANVRNIVVGLTSS